MDFFITGYPRSKTAWLANWFTDGECFCFHDGIEKGKLNDIPATRKEVDRYIIGNSDCGNALFWGDLSVRFPDAQWVVVDRPIGDVVKSIECSIGYNPELIEKTNELFTNALEDLKRHLDPFVIPFDFSREELQGLNEYLGVDFSLERYYSLRTLNIQVTEERLSELLTQY